MGHLNSDNICINKDIISIIPLVKLKIKKAKKNVLVFVFVFVFVFMFVCIYGFVHVSVCVCVCVCVGYSSFLSSPLSNLPSFPPPPPSQSLSGFLPYFTAAIAISLLGLQLPFLATTLSKEHKLNGLLPFYII